MSEEKFHEVSQKAEDAFNNVVSKIALPYTINFKLIGNDTQKNLVKLSKVADVYSYLTSLQVLVIFNNTYIDALDDEAVEILIQQELDRLQFNMKTGKISISAPELQTSVGVVKKYGIDEVARANKLEELYAEQKADDDPNARNLAAEKADYIASTLANSSNEEVEFLN